MILMLLIIGLSLSLIISMFMKIKKDKNLESIQFLQLQNKKAESSASGIYQIVNFLLEPMNHLPGNGSINTINSALGYNTDLVSTVISSQLILVEFVVVDNKSLTPLYFGMRDKDIVPSYKDMEMDLQRLDWDFQKQLF